MEHRYGHAHPEAPGAPIDAVEPRSAAADAGIEPGGYLISVDGQEIRDLLDWKWETDDELIIDVIYQSPDGTRSERTLTRTWGSGWGLTFRGVVYDGVRICRNACTFCFMTMLPPDARSPLLLRDDDYRLSFLEGNFVTFTNLDDEDVDRIIGMNLSPVNMSLHAVTPEVRRTLIGRNHARGLEVLDELLEAGIEIHAQIVLLPGENDGEELERTLDFIEERPGITSLGIVPLGYTKHQKRFTSSYDEDPAAARTVIETVEPYRERSFAEAGTHRFHLGDEFHIAAGTGIPEADEYDGFPQFDDGIGMIRSSLDGIAEAESSGLLAQLAEVAAQVGLEVRLIVGTSLGRILTDGNASADVREFGRVIEPLIVRNHHFGGNVDVTGLITAPDVLGAVGEDLGGTLIAIPSVMVNHDGVLLCDTPVADLIAELEHRGARAVVVPDDVHGMVRTLLSVIA